MDSRFDKFGVRWSLPVIEPLDPAQRALVDAVCAAGEGPVGTDDPLPIVLDNIRQHVNFTYLGQSPLYMAANTGKQGVVDVLLRWPHPAPIDTNLPSDAGETPLLAACRRGHLGIAKALMSHEGTDLNRQAADGRSALWCACHNGHVDVVRWMLDTFEPGVVNWETSAQGMPGRRINCKDVARARGFNDVVPIVEEGLRRFQGDRARSRLRRAAAGAHVAVRLRDADGVFFAPSGALDAEMSREHHTLGDETGIDYSETRAKAAAAARQASS